MKNDWLAAALKLPEVRWLMLIPAFGVSIVAVMWICVLSQLDTERKLVLDAALRDTESYVKAFAEHTQRILGEADRTALLLKYQFEKDGAIDLPRMVARDLIPDGAFLAVSVVDRLGIITTSTRGDIVGISVADRDYFRTHASADTRKLNISKPLKGRASGKTFVQLTRRLNSADGSFAGVVLLSAEPKFFTDSYQEADLGKHGLLEVLDLEGTYLARRKGAELSAGGPDTGAAELARRVEKAPTGTFEATSPFDDVTRLVAFRALSERGIVVAAAQAKDEVFADYVRHRADFLLFTWLVSLLVLAVFAIGTVQVLQLQRSRQRARLARETLRAAANGSLDAFYLLSAVRDHSGNISDFVFQECNDRGAELVRRGKPQVVGQRLCAMLPIVRTSGLFDRYVHVVESGRLVEAEFEIHDADIDAHWLRQQVVKVNDGVAITSSDISQRKRDADELHRAQRLLQTILDNIPIGVVVRRVMPDGAGVVVLWNKMSERIYGVPADSAIGKTARDLLPATAAEAIEVLDRELIASPEVQELRQVIDGGGSLTQRTIRLLRAPMFVDDNRLEYIVAIATDVTEDEAHVCQIELASKVYETTADGIVITDADDRVMMVNGAFTRLTGFTPTEVVGKTMSEGPFRPLDLEASAARFDQQLRDGFISCEVQRRRKDGSALALWVTASLVRNKDNAIVNNVRVFSDISQLKDSQRRLEILARQDPLTGLANRRVFHELLSDALLRARRLSHSICLLFLDLDRFKQVNDTLGHAVGDLLLKEVATRLQSCVRATDHVCRLGGDEFTVILEDASLAADPLTVVDRIVAALKTPVLLDGHTLEIAASIGVATYSKDCADAEALVSNADAAMYKAKQGGERVRYEQFSPREGRVAHASEAKVIQFHKAAKDLIS